MNRNFKLRFDQMKEGNPAEGEPQASALPEEEFTRPLNLCLVWPDGKRFFLNYSYLVAGELDLEGEHNQIHLHFTAYDVLLKGYGLQDLFMALLEQWPAQLMAIEPRYVVSGEALDGTIIEISVEKRE